MTTKTKTTAKKPAAKKPVKAKTPKAKPSVESKGVKTPKTPKAAKAKAPAVVQQTHRPDVTIVSGKREIPVKHKVAAILGLLQSAKGGLSKPEIIAQLTSKYGYPCGFNPNTPSNASASGASGNVNLFCKFLVSLGFASRSRVEGGGATIFTEATAEGRKVKLPKLD